MIILAGVTIFILSETGVIERANEARFKSTMKSYAEEINIYISDKLVTDGSVNTDNINVALSTTDENLELKKIIPNVKKEHIKYLSIEKGVLVFNVVDKNSADDLKYGYWACQAGITVKDFDTCDDLYNADKKPYYTGQWLDEEGVNAPDFTGFNIARTRYVSYTAAGEEVIGDTIDKNPPTNWFEYTDETTKTNNKWATIVVENAGNKAYFVWIPKYEYIIESGVTKLAYISREKTTPKLNYIIPEAFTWNTTDVANGSIINLAGIWVSKYKVSNNNSINTDFTYIVSGNKINVTVSTVSTTKDEIFKYYYYIAEEGATPVKKAESSNSYEFSSLKIGNTYDILVQVYTVDGNGAITNLAGECQKSVMVETPEAPDTTGFNTSSTRYISYDSNGEETIGNNLSGNIPSNWYDYSEKMWANILVSNNYNAAYFTWIPKYEYKTYYYNGTLRTDINFIPTIKTTATQGFKIPEAFIWDMTDNNGSILNLKGIWVSKYKVSSNKYYLNDFVYKAYSTYIDVTATNTTYTVSSGTLKYNFYIAKHGEQLVNKEENNTGVYTFSGLDSGETYDVIVKITNIDSNGSVISNVGVIEKSIYLYSPIAPILTGFNPSNTKYITWDSSDNEVEGNNISGAAPNNWYNYQTNNWANIKTINGNNAAYLTWIPRYEYITYYYNNEIKTNINFIPATKTTSTSGFKIPEAFTWDMTDNNGSKINLEGIWVSKYKVSSNN